MPRSAMSMDIATLLTCTTHLGEGDIIMILLPLSQVFICAPHKNKWRAFCSWSHRQLTPTLYYPRSQRHSQATVLHCQSNRDWGGRRLSKYLAHLLKPAQGTSYSFETTVEVSQGSPSVCCTSTTPDTCRVCIVQSKLVSSWQKLVC